VTAFAPGPADKGADSAPQAAAKADTRSAVPSQAAVQEAAERIRTVFKTDIAASKTPQAKVALANKLIRVAADDANPTNRFVLLSMGIDLATGAGDLDVAESAVQALETQFSVDGAVLRSSALTQALKVATGAELASAIDRSLAEATKSLADGDADRAASLARDASVAARRAKDRSRQSASVEVLNEIKAYQKNQEKLEPLLSRIRANPSDTEALEAVGSFYCFERENWDQGLPFLARMDAGRLCQLARLDLAAGDDGAKLLECADGWTAFAEGKPKPIQVSCLKRAQQRYEKAMPSLAGLAKARVAEALTGISKKIGVDMSNWIVAFRSADPRIWNTQVNADFLNYAVPIATLPPGIRYVRVKRANGEQVIVAMTKERLVTTSQDGRFGWSGDGKLQHNDAILGIFDTEPPVPRQHGKVAIGYAIDGKPDAIYTGWGFGHAQLSGSPQDFCWHGDRLNPEVVEIAVLCRELNSSELAFLLR
jgi:hypothetical protein